MRREMMVVGLVCAFSSASQSQENTGQLILEAYPDAILAKIELRDRNLLRSVPRYVGEMASELVIDDLKTWPAGDSLTVSFSGGNRELHQKIANLASRWIEFGNIKFDFGLDEEAGTYRTWTPQDESNIRVGFSYKGYWSLVGQDSNDPDIVGPGDITLNLGGFDDALPSSWRATVLHEFGHALGFHHEHQSPAALCEEEFDWPKLYEYLGGPPNNWPVHKVDHNLRRLPGGGLTASAHDQESIMHYAFGKWMYKTELFLNGNTPTCYIDANTRLSASDKEMMLVAYPRTTDALSLWSVNREKHLRAFIDLKNLHSTSQAKFIDQLQAVTALQQQ